MNFIPSEFLLVDDRDKKSERRKQACAERLRTNNFICIGCGCTYSCASERQGRDPGIHPALVVAGEDGQALAKESSDSAV
jgi:hypothetical protein